MMQIATTRQRGVFTIITAIGALCLVVILGLVVDGSRLMVVQGELKSASDACALAAAAELNGDGIVASGGTARAAAAGSQVGGTMNKINFQSAPANISTSDIKFSTSLNGTYIVPLPGSTINYRFVQCTARYSSWINLFMGLVPGLGGSSPEATSIAGLMQTRKACVLPLALKIINTSPPNFGYVATPIAMATLPAVILGNLRVSNYEGPVLSRTVVEYKNLINGYGFCNVSTELANVIDFDDAGVMGAAIGALPGRFVSNRNRFFSIPFVSYLSPTTATVRGWACLEFDVVAGNILYRGDATAKSLVTLLPISPCVTSGVVGFNAKGPFAPVLVK